MRFEWATSIPKPQWETYLGALKAMRAAGIPYMLGGAFALAAFTGRWRDTKDIDLYVHPGDRDRAVTVLTKAGFSDYYDRLPYDRKWIYRSIRFEVIVDIIWAMANQRAQVDPIWFERAGRGKINGVALPVLPPEEFLWCKLYILQRDHCDWTDIVNLLYAVGPVLDWQHLLARVGREDEPLLRGLLNVYSWLCPAEAIRLPEWLWERLKMVPPSPPEQPPAFDHIRLLDSRAWFVARLARGEKLAL
jgi:hypothetical protein